LPRRGLCARALSFLPSIEGDGAPKSANLWCPRFLLGNAAGASRRANKRSSSAAIAHQKMRVCNAAVAHAICGVLIPAPGPAFSVGLKLPTSVSQLLAGTPSGPGGSSDTARVTCQRTHPAGAAPRPAFRALRDSAPQRTRRAHNKARSSPGDKFASHKATMTGKVPRDRARPPRSDGRCASRSRRFPHAEQDLRCSEVGTRSNKSCLVVRVTDSYMARQFRRILQNDDSEIRRRDTYRAASRQPL
jgi:hypothetical protein